MAGGDSSTEIFLNDVWSVVGELPNSMTGVRAVSVDNTIILTGISTKQGTLKSLSTFFFT